MRALDRPRASKRISCLLLRRTRPLLLLGISSHSNLRTLFKPPLLLGGASSSLVLCPAALTDCPLLIGRMPGKRSSPLLWGFFSAERGLFSSADLLLEAFSLICPSSLFVFSTVHRNARTEKIVSNKELRCWGWPLPCSPRKNAGSFAVQCQT